MLGERYLWVDRLCIVQDALGDTASEVMRMDQIYSGAYLTIIAAGTNGLSTESRPPEVHGVCDTSFCKPNQTRTRCSSAQCINQQITAHYRNLSKSKWATRGWTYQEQILSKRSIILLDSEFFWECDQSIWDGYNLVPENDGPQKAEATDMGRRLLASRWPDFGIYIDLVCLYNYRDLSYHQDALTAISGVLNVMQPVYPGGFVGGLPCTFLDHSLLWQPLRKARRRAHTPDDLHTLASGQNLPSWSWCGWQCRVDPRSLQSGLAYLDTKGHQALAGTWITRNLVTWSVTTSSGDESAIYETLRLDEQVTAAGESGGCSLAQTRKKKARLDTSRSRTQDDPALWSSDVLPFVPSYNGDDETPFKYPIPVGEASVSHNIDNARQWLRCTTTRVFFRPAAVLQPVNIRLKVAIPKISAFDHPLVTSCPGKDQATPGMVLQDTHGRRAGLLRLMHDEEDYDRLDQIELIAISTGSCSAHDMLGCFEEQAFRG